MGPAPARLRRWRARAVDRLRAAAFGRHLIRYWEEAVDDLDVRNSVPPELRNQDGDPVLLTVDHFEVAPARHRQNTEKERYSGEFHVYFTEKRLCFL